MSDLPPLDLQQAYVVVGSNEQVGPYALELLISEVVAGRLADTTPVWWPPLADWTTMSMHPGVSGEIARRRASSGAAPAWAAPAPTHNEPASAEPSTSASPELNQPVGGTYEAAPAAASVFDGPTSTSVFDAPAGSAAHSDAYASTTTENPSAAAGTAIVDAEIIDAEVIDDPVVDVEVIAAELIDDSTRSTFNALVERSSRRAEEVAKVEAADELFVNEVISAATSLGFGLDDRTDVDSRHEIRMGEATGNLLVISIGQILAQDAGQIRESALPVTISYRADSTSTVTAAASSASPAHGELVITPDEWTGQTTSSVSLFLSVDDYLNEDLALIGDNLHRDICAVIQVVRARLA